MIDIYEILKDYFDDNDIAYNGETLFQLCLPIQRHIEETAE